MGKELGMIRYIRLLLALLVVFLIVPKQGYTEAVYHIFVDGEEVVSEDSILLENGHLYVPLRLVVESFEAEVAWNDKADRVDMKTSLGDELSFTIDKYTIKWNGKTYISDAAAFMKQGRSYLPLRQLGEFLHANVTWDKRNHNVNFDRVPLYIVQQGDTLEAIAEKTDTTVRELKERNKLTSNALTVDQTLKVIIPGIIKNQEKFEDAPLLAKIIDAEAHYEPLKGQIAIGNVIVNRTKDDRFPDTIHDVIYAQNQFAPAMNGELERMVPSESGMEAAIRALSGENYVEDAVYFYNPKRDSSSFFKSLETVGDIGSHRFAK